MFSESCGVRVVVELRDYSIVFFDFGSEREVTPTRDVRWIQNDAGARVERTGRADAYWDFLA
jgi:hypothetical protein